MPLVFLGLGSNIGDRFFYIRNAIESIGKSEEIELLNCSSIYETEPWGFREQAEFLNCAVQVRTELSPASLMSKLKIMETELGRNNRKKWSEREIDIDILFYDDLVYKDENLEIPHCEIANRKFVLVPMSEIAPDFIHPVTGENIQNMLNNTKDESNVIRKKLLRI